MCPFGTLVFPSQEFGIAKVSVELQLRQGTCCHYLLLVRPRVPNRNSSKQLPPSRLFMGVYHKRIETL